MWVAPDNFPAIGDLPLIAIDTETDDKGLQAKMGSGWFNKNGEILGISIAFYYEGELHKAYYPIAHASGNLPKATVINWLKRELAKPNIKVFHNAVYDIGWLGTEGIEVKGTIYDTGYAAALLDENRFSYKLDDLAKEELGIGKDYTLLEEYVQEHGKELGIRTVKQLMSMLKSLPASLVGPYAEQDAEITLRLWTEKYEKDLYLYNLFSLYKLECRGIPLLIAMRKQGVPIDIPRIKELIVKFKDMEKELQEKLNEMAGEEFPLTRTKKHTELIVKVVGEDNFKKSEAGNYLTGKKHTNKLDHPFIKTLNELNSVTKLRKEFLENFLKFEVDGRLHPEFNPLKSSDLGAGKLISTTTGRYSSTCIAKGTMISLVGEDKPIEEVKVGDLVYCYDEDNNLRISKVTGTYYKGLKECVSLNWKGTGNKHTGSLVCTPDHWIRTEKEWIPAADLEINKRVLHLHKSYKSRVRLFYYQGDGCTEEQFIKKEYFQATAEKHIHHKDGCKTNNIVDNLVVLSASEHCRLHNKELLAQGRIKWEHLKDHHPTIRYGAEHPCWKEISLQDIKNELKRVNGKVKEVKWDYYTFIKHCEVMNFNWRKEASKYNRKYIAEVITIEDISEAFEKSKGKITLAAKHLNVGYDTLVRLCKKYDYSYNHRVKSITPAGTHEVYDLQVEAYHNFIAGEICVHNCPNLTNIPAEGELGHMIRSCFIPEHGEQWLCADYSQQEYRWAAHYAIKAKCRGYKTILQMYKENPKLDFHNMGSMLLYGNTDKHNRKKVKTVGFGILYGSGTSALAQSLNMSKQEAEEFLAKYHEKVPFVKDIADKARLHATHKGVIRTALGRARRYDFWEVAGDYKHEYGVIKGEANARLKQKTPGSDWFGKVIQRCKTYTAINSACQGSSADQTKLAVITLFEKYGLVPYTIVHDEINLSVPKGDTKIKDIVVETMENVLKLEVPVRAEAEVADNWADAKG